MKNGKVFFRPLGGSAPLTISWSSEPKGDALEAAEGYGVGFFSKKGVLVCVIFDDVCADNDHQVLTFKRERVEVTVKMGRVNFHLSERALPAKKSKIKLKPMSLKDRKVPKKPRNILKRRTRSKAKTKIS